MTDVFQIIEGIELDTKSGIEFTGGQDKYVSALQRFYKGYEENKNKLKGFYEARDYENYMIIVHALKSNAKMIGAIELSKNFEILELAAKEQDEGLVSNNNGPTLEAYSNLIEKLRPIGEMEQVKAIDEISATEAKEVADMLLEALEDFDDELAGKLADKLAGYPFRITQKEMLKEAKSSIEDFMYDEAAEIIKELQEVIE